MRWVAFLRGINVGGNRKVPMADLRRICTKVSGDPNPRSYIASGNVVFEGTGTAAGFAHGLEAEIADAFGFNVPVLVLDGPTMRAVLNDCPFPMDAGKLVHGFLCFSDPLLDHEAVDALKTPTEQVAICGRTVWLFAPDGIGRSKLAAKMERLLGAKATARNLNTMKKMVEMLDSLVG